MSYSRFLDELAEAGYEWLELGPYGYLPTDPQRLKAQLDARGLKVSCGTAFGTLHRPEAFVRLYVPETKGRTLESLEAELRARFS